MERTGVGPDWTDTDTDRQTQVGRYFQLWIQGASVLLTCTFPAHISPSSTLVSSLLVLQPQPAVCLSDYQTDDQTDDQTDPNFKLSWRLKVKCGRGHWLQLWMSLILSSKFIKKCETIPLLQKRHMIEASRSNVFIVYKCFYSRFFLRIWFLPPGGPRRIFHFYSAFVE